tara:strand:- start:39 stop:455 length:417 start_codon:yes stop_codon:yes gene_type:complete
MTTVEELKEQLIEKEKENQALKAKLVNKPSTYEIPLNEKGKSRLEETTTVLVDLENLDRSIAISLPDRDENGNMIRAIERNGEYENHCWKGDKQNRLFIRVESRGSRYLAFSLTGDADPWEENRTPKESQQTVSTNRA